MCFSCYLRTELCVLQVVWRARRPIGCLTTRYVSNDERRWEGDGGTGWAGLHSNVVVACGEGGRNRWGGGLRVVGWTDGGADIHMLERCGEDE